MRRSRFALLLGAVLAASPSVVLAQADARAAFDAARQAYQAGDYQKARDQFLSASRTDTRNPEVFLWLGRSYYQLGQVTHAMEAWKTTLELAPDEPYAAQMLTALRGDLGRAENVISLIDVLISRRLYPAALAQSQELLENKALTDAQRARGMLLRAQALLGAGRPGDVPPLLQELRIALAGQAGEAQIKLLLGQAYVRMGGRHAAEGLGLLRGVAADATAGALAVSAQFELARFELSQAATPQQIQAMAKWLSANPQHELAADGRRELVEACLSLAAQAPPPADSPLSELDAQAIAMAGELYRQIVAADEAARLTQRLVDHLQALYGAKQASEAAISGIEALLKAPLPPSSRVIALRELARHRCDLVVRQLQQSIAATGGADLKPNVMPPELTRAMEALATVGREFPAQPALAQQAALAQRVRELAGLIAMPARPTALKPPQAWAMDIALGVVRADADGEAGRAAISTINSIVGELSALKSLEAQRLAAAAQGQLVAALPTRATAYAQALWTQAELLDGIARRELAENVRSGNAQENARLSATQKQFVEVLARAVSLDSASAQRAIDMLAAHAQLWANQGYINVADAAFTMLDGSIPAVAHKPLRLAAVRTSVNAVMREHQRMLTAGIAPPRELDPALRRAVEELYALHSGLSEAEPLIVELRNVWSSIVAHYSRMDYFDVAERAITTRPATAVAAADAHAQLQLAGLRLDQARRELAEMLKQHDAAGRLKLTAAYQAAIEAYRSFVTSFPQSPLVDQAVAAMFEVGRDFERQQAFDVAVEVYRGLVAFAQQQPRLAQATATSPSVPQRAALAAAGALDAKAAAAMAKLMAERKPDTAAPAKLSAEHAAAVEAYKQFIKAHPNSALLGTAMQRISAVALQYAQADAWDVADGVYAELLGAGLPLRNPQRLEFARAMCLLGKAMPEHARQVLAQLTARTDWADEKSDVSGMMMGGPMGAPATRPKDEPARAAAGARGRGGAIGGGGYGGWGYDDGPGRGAVSSATPALPLEPSLKLDSIEGERLAKPYEPDIASIGAIAQSESRRAAQVAQLREEAVRRVPAQVGKRATDQLPTAMPVLSDAELARIEGVFDTAYKAFEALRQKYAATAVADLSRQEMLLMIGHWRSLGQWQRSAALAQRFLTDHPADGELPQLRFQIAQDLLNWAAQPPTARESRQAMLAEVAERFEKARAELSRIAADFAADRELLRRAQWELATSYMTQAGAVDAFSPTLSRGQYVRAARELLAVARAHPDHPRLAEIPGLLARIGGELAGRGHFEEAIIVFNDLMHFDPAGPQAQQAAQQIAGIYHNRLGRPLKAVEMYLEIAFSRGDGASQNTILQIGQQLRSEKRWVEALSVLETFVDAFPRNAAAGQALTMIGQIHQANEAWQDAIAAYKRVITDFPAGNWIQEAKWSIAECTINLSQWREAIAAYEDFVQAYGRDTRVAEANRRIGVLKDLARYQSLVDEPNQRKAFDAQFQIASIIQRQLNSPRKAIAEFRKVAANWPTSYLAAESLYSVGTIYLGIGEIDEARQALRLVASRYPDSNLADDALLALGRSYEEEAQRLAGLTRVASAAVAQERAQREAYQQVQEARSRQMLDSARRIGELRAEGKSELADLEQARFAGGNTMLNDANFELAAQRAQQAVETLTAVQLADRQDKINAALRRAVEAYDAAARVPLADKAADALLRMAVIFDEQLRDSAAALTTWKEIVSKFSGNVVAEEASWRIAKYYERAGNWAEAVEAYKAFLRNYRSSPRAADAQFAIAEGFEHLDKWVEAMDAYTNYLNNFATGPLAAKAKEQINWIKTYRL